jgi:hypothetical protein
MLSHTFCCFRGLSPDAERRLWREGCLTWDHLPRLAHRLVSARKVPVLLAQLPLLRAALDGRVADVFLKRLPTGHRARLWPEFGRGMGFLDVETTGLERCDEITVIGLHVGGVLHQFVRGRNLEDFVRVWRQVETLVTFNGAAFDLPRVTRAFGLTTTPPHLDLRAESRAHGLVGGLKEIERNLGIVREEIETGGGALAAEWWTRHAQQGDAEALDRLLRYNARDTLSLLSLTEHLWQRSMEGYPEPLPQQSRTV